MSQQSKHAHERAVVIGASMVGLAVARALSERFREVVIVERDSLAGDLPAHRPGVPQSWHIHNLTLRGQRELEELFPGFVETAVNLGAMRIDHALDVVAFTTHGWEELYESEFIALSATRVLLEFAERQRFRALVRNATLLENTRVEDLIVESHDDQPRAVGVLTNHREQREIHADLVVDCSGRSSRWKERFTRRQIPLPRETVVDSRCGYSSRFYRPRNPAEFSWKGMIVDVQFPHQPRWGVIVPLENNDWVVTLGGFGGKYPPSDETGFLAFGKQLKTPLFNQALERADPLTRVRTFRRLEMRWSHFERYAHPLKRFLAIGDSAWAYNPLYGQGMSIGVTCARILRDVLAESPELADLPARFYPRATKFAFPPWEATALMDMRWPTTTGKRPWHAGITLPLSELMLRTSQDDQTVSRTLLQGVHLLKSPYELVDAGMLARMARYGWKRLTTPITIKHDLPIRPADSRSPEELAPVRRNRASMEAGTREAAF